MSTYPRITIVTPSFNQAAFLEATLRSVLDQEYDNLEYIVMDGGSTDGSRRIIERYADRLAHWRSGPDGGQSNALNQGFARATGDVLNWINSDDRLKPGALHAVADAIRREPDAGAWVGACELVDEQGTMLQTVAPRGVEDRSLMADWGGRGHFFQPSCFFRREAWERYGPLDERLYACFDFDFFLKVAADCRFHPVDEVWSEATIHRNAKTTADKPRLRAERYLVQARHGFEDLARDKIEQAERDAIRWRKVSGLVMPRWAARLKSRLVGR